MSVLTAQARSTAVPCIAAGSALAAGALLGPLLVRDPALVLVGTVAVLMLVVVWRVPAVAAILVIAVTPLVAGIDRGRVLPVLRPNEALVAGLGGVLVLRALLGMRPGLRISWRPSRLELSLVAMAVANSVLPIIWMVLRGRAVGGDDISYALVLWKYLAVYALVRATVRTERAVRWCLWASVLSASVVALIGILQALDLLAVRSMLAGYYAPFGYSGSLSLPRGGSTLGLPAAAADLLTMNLVVAIGLWWKDHRPPALLAAAGLLCVLGALAAAEFSSALGLVIAIVCVATVLHRPRLLAYLPMGAVPAAVLLWPVIQHRLLGFQGAAGIPVSWTTRWSNLRNYFWPELFHGSNPILGVRPSARVAVQAQGTGYVWIESGYTWLLWGGGLALLLAFLWFVRVAGREMLARCRPLTGYPSVAALAAYTGVVVIVVLMVFDPHLTYRGSADALYGLLALAVADRVTGGTAGRQLNTHTTGGRP